MIMIKMDVNDVFVSWVETNENGIILIDSKTYPTMPIYANIKLTVFNDLYYENKTFTLQFIDQYKTYSLMPKQNANVTVTI